MIVEQLLSNFNNNIFKLMVKNNSYSWVEICMSNIKTAMSTYSKFVYSIKALVSICTDKNLSITNRCYSHADLPCPGTPSGLVLGLQVYDNDFAGQQMKFFPSGAKFNDKIQGRLMEILRIGALPPPRLGEVRVIYGVDFMFPAVAVCGVGSECLTYNPSECIDERKEAIRLGIGAGVRALQFHSFRTLYIDSCNHAESAAEGAALAVWLYQELRHSSQQKSLPRLELYDNCDYSGWRIGLEKASAQNLARRLQETPRNLLTPTNFAQTAVEILSKVGICVDVKMKNWARLRNLNAFLTVAKGSCEPPVFLETLYEGCDPDICPIVMIGKGTTFNTGGLCVKTYKDAEHMRGDMSGAACIVATLKAVAALQLPVNIRALIPLCENSLGATSYKPGDICASLNNKTILIEDTECEGILMFADALNYAENFKPKFILAIGTMTPDMERGLGSAAVGVYSNSESLYETLRVASIHTGDRVWRLPMWKYFTEYATDVSVSDLTNQKAPKHIGGPSKIVGFLREFLPDDVDWIHIDNTGVAMTSGDVYTYLREGMSGRPTRTLIEFIAQLACQIETKTK
ncbi:cytosol aminopeptidase-like [Lycorma delicatula]|uniref:cytosol aminopeptidase-like n=1 Tax=Lycorma delicatula TaxID=130591 RepID=UPI003F50F9AD